MNNHFFIRKADVSTVSHELQKLGVEIGWFFVTIDSYRGDFDRISKSISGQLMTHNINHIWSKHGLWLQNSELVKPIVQEKIIPPFSSGYIFFEKPSEFPNPFFNETTDSSEEFSSGDLEACFVEIYRVGAAGYVADGAGLQCLFIDNRLTSACSELIVVTDKR